MTRNHSNNRICQVDIADTYDHKHQDLSPNDETAGLSRMSIDISKAIFRKLATNGIVFSQETFRTIKATYYRVALDFADIYKSDAEINGLKLDLHSEKAVELFALNLMKRPNHFLENPTERGLYPQLEQSKQRAPGLVGELLESVEADMNEFG